MSDFDIETIRAQVRAMNFVRGTPAEVRAATLDVLEKSGGEGIVLSVGGGTSPGMPRQNIVAMQQALAEFNLAHFGRS